MNQQILLGVDMALSPTTNTMLQMARTFLVQLAPHCQVLLLTVIPVPCETTALPRAGALPGSSDRPKNPGQAHLTAGASPVGARRYRGSPSRNAGA